MRLPRCCDHVWVPSYDRRNMISHPCSRCGAKIWRRLTWYEKELRVEIRKLKREKALRESLEKFIAAHGLTV